MVILVYWKDNLERMKEIGGDMPPMEEAKYGEHSGKAAQQRYNMQNLGSNQVDYNYQVIFFLYFSSIRVPIPMNN